MAFSLIVGAGFFIMAQRRVALSRLLATEAQANRKLEDQVLRRTEQLSGVNQRLRQQINERIDAEEALNRAQQDLVQAGKLSALGQMSAGISHELNQPLMAIRSFAENAEVFLERGQLDTTKANLGRISDLARRMGRIIKNLRAFARKEGEPMTEVDLCAVIDASLELNDNRMQQAGVEVTWSAPLNAVWVRGGEVRLQQVLINLLGNAVDAMEDLDGTAEKRIEISIAQTGGTVILSVRDTGPGLSEPEKIFDPFYTTKKVGQSEGMGLGLSISYGIVQSFGGKIAGRNHPDGGSVFTVELALVANEAAA
ncbi:MAG: ATP-binding protein [Proteobacteria bacterium]|nr:ATP-binding protein [Pseudomonadota bacterium]